MTGPTPLVSIGIPVFNGADYLEDAIVSVLAQGLDDFELLISDNASSDRTAEIALDFAQSDCRVRYFKNSENIGAASNYNKLFHASKGKYFKWLAHDDRIASDYVSMTVQELERRSDVVLCHSLIRFIGGDGRAIADFDSGLGASDRERPSDRFGALVLRSHPSLDFFGMIRREAMRGSILHGTFHGGDRAFLAQMGLRGRLAQLNVLLAEIREHPNRYTRKQESARARQRWHDPSRDARFNVPSLTLYRAYLAMVAAEALPAAEARRCRAALAKWWFVNWNAARVGVDLASALYDGLPGRAERYKNRVFGHAPGHFVQ